MLSEAKIDDYKAQETNISTTHDPNAEHKKPENIIDHFHKHVPGGNVEHTRWLVDRYKNGEMKQEDAPDMKDMLTSYNKYKDKLSKKRIGQYKSVSELKTVLHPFSSKDTEKQNINQKAIDEGSTKVHSSPNLDMYHVHTRQAACALGTKPNGEKLGWCTSHPDPDQNMFDHYNERSNGNFHIAHLHKEEFPFRRIGGIGVSGEFQDENNENIEGSRFRELIKRNPELEKVKAVTDSKNYKMMKIADNPNATKEHLDKAINDQDEYVRRAAAGHPNATKEHLDKAINHQDGPVREVAAGHPNATKEHLDKAINDQDGPVREAAARNPNATKEHLDKAINDQDEYVRLAAARHPNATKEHLDKAINDQDEYVRLAAAGHPNATKEHLDKAINDQDEYVRRAAAGHPNATKEHLDKAINDQDEYVRRAAAGHPNATKEHLDKAINDQDEVVRNVAAGHPNRNR